jgi:hypothetical protein
MCRKGKIEWPRALFRLTSSAACGSLVSLSQVDKLLHPILTANYFSFINIYQYFHGPNSVEKRHCYGPSLAVILGDYYLIFLRYKGQFTLQTIF